MRRVRGSGIVGEDVLCCLGKGDHCASGEKIIIVGGKVVLFGVEHSIISRILCLVHR